MSPFRSSRGQTLVLFSLSLLLLTLLVAMTLSMGMKIRERVELQTVADAAAYSNAVATARTFNNIAVLNRAQIAFAVSQAGAQSLISWSSAYMGYVNAAQAEVSVIQGIYALYTPLCACAWSNGACFRACQCGTRGVTDTGRIQTRLTRERARLRAAYQALDGAAAAQVARTQYVMTGIYAAEQGVYRDLKSNLGSQDFAKKVVSNAAPLDTQGEWSVSPAAVQTTNREISGGAMCISEGAACDLPFTVSHAVSAAMGSRGYPFVAGRTGELFSFPFDVQLMRLMPPPDVAMVLGHSGSGWFTAMHGSRMDITPPYANAVGADDHGVLATIYNHAAHGGGPPCPILMGATLPVVAQAQATGVLPVHVWTGGADARPNQHRLIPCLGGLSSCPGIWPPFMDYNIWQVNNGDNNFGQPKNFVMVQRDPAVRTVQDPFNLAFNFNFSPSTGSGSSIDLRTPTTAKQTALSTGIAYYHRGEIAGFQHWDEPPNLLNPYWRATLVAADTDSSGLSDAADTLGRGGDLEGKQALNALLGQGFKGFQ